MAAAVRLIGADERRIRGIVERVDLEAGTLVVDAGRHVTLQDTPADAARYAAGTLVDVDVRAYGDRLWMPPSPPPPVVEGALTATVTAEDRAAGVVDVGGARLRIHPEALRGVLPGMRATVSFSRMGAGVWVQALTLQGAAGGRYVEDRRPP